jgi:outer membrane beta-barrel protein
MKQARRWLLLAAALVLLPQAAYAQKKKPKGGTPAPANPPAAAAAPPAGGGGTTSAPADADADAPAGGATPPAAAAGGDATGATPAPAGGDTGGMDICQITPDAPQCAAAKEINFGEEAKKQVHAEVYAVQQQYVIKAQRFEIMPYWVFADLNDQFVSHPGPGLALNYYITQVLAAGITGVWYGGLNGDSDFNFQNRRAARIAVPLNEYNFSGDVNFTYVPMYGKFSGFGDFIFNYDAYILGGLGVIQTRPIAVIDPDNRKFNWNTFVNFDVGIGFRIFFTRWLAAVLEIRDIIYFDKLENLQVANGPSTLPSSAPNSPLNQSTWYDSSTHFTNDVQLQVGISLFLPTSFEYRLPK